MTVVFACRDSAVGRYIATVLCRQSLIDAVIVESGSHANKRKLKRLFAGKRLYHLPMILIDVAAVYIYSRLCEMYLKYRLAPVMRWDAFPRTVKIFTTPDINSKPCDEFFRAIEPDLTIVFGTSILTPAVLSLPKQFTLNIHGGIVPRYRNVHSDFWAYRNNDTANIGTSILYLNKGIDSGDIACVNTIPQSEHDGIFSIKRKNAQLASQLIMDAICMAENNELPRIKQKDELAKYYSTPRLFDILVVLTKSMLNKFRF